MPNASFALIRYVPDLAKGERINIGLVWRYGEEVGIRLRDEWEKVRLFDANVNIELLKSSADVILSAVTARGQLDDSVAREFSSSVQLSPVTALPVGGESIKNVVEMVFQSLVETKPIPPNLSPDVLEKLRAIVHNFALTEHIEKGDIEGAKRA